jgi:parallel beta-helix repeat protein
VTDLSTSSVVLAHDVFQADGILNATTATPPVPIGYHYAPATRQNLPALDCENLQPADCKGVYWLRLFATPTSAYWNTTQYPDGDYRIDMTAWDTHGNSTSSSASVAIANGSASASTSAPVDAPPAGPASRRLSCGDTITTDTTLDSDLLDCPSNGIVIGADDVTLDLNGHTVSGDGQPVERCPEGQRCDVGVLNDGHDGVTVQDGSVRQFDSGVLVDGARENRVLNNELRRNRGPGILIRDSAGILIKDNLVTRSAAGVLLSRGNRNVVSRNVVRRSGKDGFAVRRNDHHSVLKGNLATRSRDDGFDVRSRSTKLVGNRAVGNDDLGIGAVAGVKDGGGNRASRNGDPRQCLKVRCR